MIHVEHHEYINRPQSFVFSAGLDTATWPMLEKLTLEARETLLQHGTNIDASLFELGQRIGVPCQVTELDPGRRLAFAGESDQARLSLGLDFRQGKASTLATEVDAALTLEIRSRLLRMTLGRAATHIAKAHLSSFGQGFRANIEALPDDYPLQRNPLAS